MRRWALLLVIVPCAGISVACVTNIEQKSAELCAPLAADSPDSYSDCITQMSGQLDAKNRRTARIIGAALGGGAPQSDPLPPRPSLLGRSAQPTGFLKRSFVSGANRVCVYDALGSDRYVTMNSIDICPPSDD